LIGIDGRCRHPHVSVGGRSAILETEGVILAIGALERPFPILGIVRLQREMSAPNERLLLAYSVEKLRFWSRSDRAALWSAIAQELTVRVTDQIAPKRPFASARAVAKG